jgi:hypothetical protein
LCVSINRTTKRYCRIIFITESDVNIGLIPILNLFTELEFVTTAVGCFFTSSIILLFLIVILLEALALLEKTIMATTNKGFKKLVFMLINSIYIAYYLSPHGYKLISKKKIDK